ncbi:hypothetical protein O3P69_001420 [Scylla paramamosain]|uniref:Uncharacterized protein n=1 Tax=Scylla paramamosain TaxID=85552 RepID=A0AAW0UYM3_SCYPA
MFSTPPDATRTPFVLPWGAMSVCIEVPTRSPGLAERGDGSVREEGEEAAGGDSVVWSEVFVWRTSRRGCGDRLSVCLPGRCCPARARPPRLVPRRRLKHGAGVEGKKEKEKEKKEEKEEEEEEEEEETNNTTTTTMMTTIMNRERGSCYNIAFDILPGIRSVFLTRLVIHFPHCLISFSPRPARLAPSAPNQSSRGSPLTTRGREQGPAYLPSRASLLDHYFAAVPLPSRPAAHLVPLAETHAAAETRLISRSEYKRD